MSDELISAADRLADKVEALEQAVATMRERTGRNELDVAQMGRRTDRTERATGWTGAGLLVLLGLIAVMGWTIWQGHATADRVESLVQRSLCPVYGLVVGGYDPTTRALNPDGSYPGSAREKYERTFDVMRSAWVALDCKSTDIVPKRVEP